MPPKDKDEERKFLREVIHLYRSLPALWNTKCREYNIKSKKDDQYRQLLMKYNEVYPDADREQLTKKLNSLRTNFRKELRRIDELKKIGAEWDEEPTLWYFDDMKFLLDLGTPNPLKRIKKFEQSYESDIDHLVTDETLDIVSKINHNDNLPRKKPRKTEEIDEKDPIWMPSKGLQKREIVASSAPSSSTTPEHTPKPVNLKQESLQKLNKPLIRVAHLKHSAYTPRDHHTNRSTGDIILAASAQQTPTTSSLEQQQQQQQPKTQNEYDIVATFWSSELQKMPLEQQMYAKKAIHDILFEGQMGTLHRNSVLINPRNSLMD